MAAERAVQVLLGSVGHAGQLDGELLQYISSILEDPDPEGCLEVLTELLAGAVPCFGNKNSEEQTQLVLQLLDDVKAQQAPQQQNQTSSMQSSDNLDAVVEVFKQASLQSRQQDAACTDITNKLPQGTGSSSSSTSREGLPSQDLSPLLDLCPASISQDFLACMLQSSFRGDVQAAADWLLECPDLLAQQESWQQQQEEQQQRRQQEQEALRKTKKQIVERFDLQVVHSMPAKPKHGVDLLPAPKKGDQQQGKVRYRDGQVVSCKGDKYIIEKVGEEWDGGSKGKVYTKGKRGVGYR
ncbi:hypothetical protein OEZ86_011938 [Tetradesmus obliquus]|nr:hypothetical protein OEZ86_011938 [Tetradesmus obliquus]